jgi:hypothetical protein
MPGINGVCFLVSGKIGCFGFPNWMVRFSKVDGSDFLTKPDVPVCQTGVAGFDRQNI